MLLLGFILIFAFAQGDSSSPLDASPELELQDVLSSTEYREYQRKSNYKGRIDIYRKALDRQAVIMRSLSRQGHTDEVFNTLHRIRSLARYVQSEPVQETKDLRSKEVKQLEIRIRRLLEIIKDLQTTVPSTEQPEFEKTYAVLEALRSELLRRMFGQTVMSEQEGQEVLGLPPADPLADAPSNAELFYSPSNAASARVVRLPSSDRFTEEEFTKIQDNQELVKRVEVFLEIAENRLKEVERRMDERPWEKDEPNPLEFFTYSDMVHAYGRAIRGIMINIDEKARYKLEETKNIRKSLEKLNEKIGEFIPRLERLREFSIRQKDKELHDEVLQALELSEQALKGSQLGLGAPSK